MSQGQDSATTGASAVDGVSLSTTAAGGSVPVTPDTGLPPSAPPPAPEPSPMAPPAPVDDPSPAATPPAPVGEPPRARPPAAFFAT